MYCFYNPNDPVVPYHIVSATFPEGETDNYGSCGGLPAVYVDETLNPDVEANMGLYKIDPKTSQPVHLTQTEIDALNAAAPVQEPTNAEKIDSLQQENSAQKLANDQLNDTINGLLDALASKGVL